MAEEALATDAQMLNSKVRIVLVGSRGIPAKYGGNEVFVEELSKELVKNGIKVYVTCESGKFYEDTYKGIRRIYIPSIEGKVITIPIINDMTATIYLLIKYRNKFDVIYYVAPDGSLPAIIAKLFGKKVLINPDGIEWKRPLIRLKYWPIYLKILSLPLATLLWVLEMLSIKVADFIIADSYEIKRYLEKRYKAGNIIFIPYGVRILLDNNLPKDRERNILKNLGLSSQSYYLTVARIVPENNIHMEIEGFKKSNSNKMLVIVGNFSTKDSYTRLLLKMKGNSNQIRFMNPIYDKEILGVLRKNCFAYIHAYSVGGTNPSLLEAMSMKNIIVAHDNEFNREVCGETAIYFKGEIDLANKIKLIENNPEKCVELKENAYRRVKENYSWNEVVKRYEMLFNTI